MRGEGELLIKVETWWSVFCFVCLERWHREQQQCVAMQYSHVTTVGRSSCQHSSRPELLPPPPVAAEEQFLKRVFFFLE